jgi:hypothetical protein
MNNHMVNYFNKNENLKTVTMKQDKQLVTFTLEMT